jgi:hypothetical protein
MKDTSAMVTAPVEHVVKASPRTLQQ